MELGTATVNHSRKRRRFAFGLGQTLAFFLLLFVPLLTTLAKNNWYLPESNPGHHLTAMSKAEVVNEVKLAFPAAGLAWMVLAFFVIPVPARPQAQEFPWSDVVEFSVSSVTVSVWLQRPPPVSSQI